MTDEKMPSMNCVGNLRSSESFCGKRAAYSLMHTCKKASESK